MSFSSAMGSMVSMSSHASSASERRTLAKIKFGGFCRLDLRQSEGRRKLWIQLLVIPSVSVFLLTAFTVWRLAQSVKQIDDLQRLTDQIMHHNQTEYIIHLLQQERMGIFKLATNHSTLSDNKLISIQDSLNIKLKGKVEYMELFDAINDARMIFRNITGNCSILNISNIEMIRKYLTLFDLYGSLISDLYLSLNNVCEGDIIFNVCKHWYAIQMLDRASEAAEKNCIYLQILLLVDILPEEILNEISKNEVQISNSIHETLSHDVDLEGEIFRHNITEMIFAFDQYIENFLLGVNHTATLEEIEDICDHLTTTLSHIKTKTYDILLETAINPEINNLWIYVSFYIFSLLVEIPVSTFIINNAKITSVSIFSSVHLFTSKVHEINKEQRRTELLLSEMLPKSIAKKLRLGVPVDAQQFDKVTVYFSDIADFTEITNTSEPMNVVALLNDVYQMMDSKIECYDVYKVETIGSTYMVASGIPVSNGDSHATEIASLAIDLLESTKTFKIAHLPGRRLMLRAGIHSGPCCAGVVGNKMPRYCLFGDTVNTASRMQSYGESLKIHISHSTYSLLTEMEGYRMEHRSSMWIKGKGTMNTYWLLGERKSKMLHPQSFVRMERPTMFLAAE